MIESGLRKQLHFEARAKALKERGIEFRSEGLMQEVASDLRLVDRVRAEGGLGEKKKRKKASKPKLTTPLRKGVARPELHAEMLARQVGGEFFARSYAETATPRSQRLTGVDAERVIAMQRRIALLSKRGPGRLKSNQTIEQGPWEYPEFARQVALTTVCFNAGLGGYKDLKPLDKRRRFFRALEDICNRSDAVIGFGWWVKR